MITLHSWSRGKRSRFNLQTQIGLINLIVICFVSLIRKSFPAELLRNLKRGQLVEKQKDLFQHCDENKIIELNKFICDVPHDPINVLVV